MKQSIKLVVLKNPQIKIGDRVYLRDGSGVTPVTSNEEVYIVNAYPHLTGRDEKLMDMIGVVVAINVCEYVCRAGFNDNLYLQDVVVCLGEGLFRTCSEFVSLI